VFLCGHPLETNRGSSVGAGGALRLVCWLIMLQLHLLGRCGVVSVSCREFPCPSADILWKQIEKVLARRGVGGALGKCASLLYYCYSILYYYNYIDTDIDVGCRAMWCRRCLVSVLLWVSVRTCSRSVSRVRIVPLKTNRGSFLLVLLGALRVRVGVGGGSLRLVALINLPSLDKASATHQYTSAIYRVYHSSPNSNSKYLLKTSHQQSIIGIGSHSSFIVCPPSHRITHHTYVRA